MTRQTYRLVSIKYTETFVGTAEEAVARAVAIEAEYQPAFGVSVEDAASGETIADIRDGVDTLDGELVEDSEVCAICAASGIETRGPRDTMTEIARDADRDGLGSSKVYACDDCVAAGTDEDRDEMGVTAEEWTAAQARIAHRVGLYHCASGAIFGDRCASDPMRATDLTVIEWMPEHLRASHDAAGNRGVYPHNGARRLVVCTDCLDALISEDRDDPWAPKIIEGADPARYAERAPRPGR